MSDILDLGYGRVVFASPGHPGHRCRGLISVPPHRICPKCSPCQSRCQFVPMIFATPYGGPFDLAMILFGEMNVFSEAESWRSCASVMHASPRSADGSSSIQTGSRRMHDAADLEQELESGLFSARPHRCRTEHRWLPDNRRRSTFTITETASMETRVYRNTTRAWPPISRPCLRPPGSQGWHSMTTGRVIPTAWRCGYAA